MTTTLLLLAAHLLGDFPLQPTSIAKNKIDDPIPRFVHVMIHTALVSVFLTFGGITPQPFILFYVAYGSAHFAIDSRRWGTKREDFPAWQFILDQVLHVTSLAILAVVFL